MIDLLLKVSRWVGSPSVLMRILDTLLRRSSVALSSASRLDNGLKASRSAANLRVARSSGDDELDCERGLCRKECEAEFARCVSDDFR